MVHAGDRDAAIDRLRRALDETEIAGFQTTLPFHRFVAQSAAFRAGELSTGWVGEWWDGPAEFRRAARVAMIAVGLEALSEGQATAIDGPAAARPATRTGDGRGAAAARQSAPAGRCGT